MELLSVSVIFPLLALCDFVCLLACLFFVSYSKAGTRKIGHEKEEKEKLN